MRFNNRARLDRGRIGDAGRGGGGFGGGFGGGGMGMGRGSGMRMPMGRTGGGIGGVLVMVLLFVLVQCVGGGGGTGGLGGLGAGGTGFDTSRVADSGRYDNCETGADANADVDCQRVAVENSLYDFWSQELGSRFRPEQLVTFTGNVQTGCGAASADVGPFYCPADEKIYLDTTFFEAVLERQLGGPSGGFVEPYVLAHEYGHHVQNLLGTMGRVRTQQGPQSDAVRLELQADCYAGMWANAATTTEDAEGNVLISELTQQDVEEAIAAAAAVGDDRIQQKTQGQVTEESWTHGSAESRMRWFTIGYEQGSLEACDTFAVDRV